jgi:hypothetical protein
MKTQASFCRILSFSAFAVTALLPRQAQARACSVASDCPKGYACEPGGPITADGGLTTTCVVSLPCQSNADCGPGFVCWQSAFGVYGPPNAGEVCSKTADGGMTCSGCVPNWDAPCLTDTDCGPGFTCSGTAGVFWGGDQEDAGEPAYTTVTVVPCSAVPMGPFSPDSGIAPGPLPVPSQCDLDSVWTDVTWNTCVAQTTGSWPCGSCQSCSVDSDCPSTWTCACQVTCSNYPLFRQGALTVDSGCALACSPPNYDLLIEGCDGLPYPPAVDNSNPDASDSEVGSGASPGVAGSSGGHGGCQIGLDGTSGSWALVTAAVLAAARARPRRKGRVTR